MLRCWLIVALATVARAAQSPAPAHVNVYINYTDAARIAPLFRQNANHLIAEIINALLVSNLHTLRLTAHYVDDYRDADVFINLDDVHSVAVSAANAWPYLQGEYCFVDSRSMHLSIYASMQRLTKSGDSFYTYLPIAITSVYHMLVMRFRQRRSVFDALTGGPVYAIQMHSGSSIPNLERYPYDKFYFAGVFVYHFVAMFIFLTFFSARSTVPDFVPMAPPAGAAPMDVAALRFGIGPDCMYELLSARYTERSCMLPCDQLPAASSPDSLVLLLSPSYVRFDNVLRVRGGRTAHVEPLVDRLQRFAQSGMFERMFGEQHRRSYAGLVESHGGPPMRLSSIIDYVYSLLAGLLVAAVAFVAELAWWWCAWNVRRSTWEAEFEFVV